MQVQAAIKRRCALADSSLHHCAGGQRKHLPCTGYSRLVLALFGAFASMLTGSTSFPGYNVYQEKNLAVFMDASLSQAEIDRIGEELKQISGITSCHFISGDEAWDAFREAYLNDDIADTFTENPLQDSFNYRLSVRLNADTQAIRDEISQINGVRLIQNLSELKQASLK